MDFALSILEQGLIYGILALGIYITYKILDFPDLTVDGSFPLGSAVTAALLTKGVNPYLSLLISFLAGVLAGTCTGLIHVKGKVRDLLSGIIMMTALYTVNLVIAGSNNVPLFAQKTIFSNSFLEGITGGNIPDYTVILLILLVAVVSKLLLDFYLKTRSGYLLRAVGDNEVLVTSLAKDKGNVKNPGTGHFQWSGCPGRFCILQQQGVFDISSGTGSMVIGLASVIVGTSLYRVFTKLKPFRKKSYIKVTTFVFLGAVLYKACTGLAIRYFMPQSMKMISALFLLAVLLLMLVFDNMDKKKVKKNA